MSHNKIINYTLNKLFFPKRIVIDKPGIIINQISRKYGSVVSKSRTIIYFEDILANLQLETIKKLGSKKSADFFYKIGKDLGTRYIHLAKAKRPPTILLPSVVDYIFSGFRSGGFSLSKNIKFCQDKKSLILEGKDNIVCRKSGDGNIFAGIVSAVFSFLMGENIETKLECKNCPEKCRIIANPEIPHKYISNLDSLGYSDKFYNQNFPSNVKTLRKMYSFSDFIKFKKISLEKDGKFIFKKVTVVPSPIDFFSIINHCYLEKGLMKLLEKDLIGGAYSIAGNVIESKGNSKEKVEELSKILCALGWGIPYFKIGRNIIHFNFIHPPLMRKEFLCLALVLNGFLNYCFNKKYKIKNIDILQNPHMVKIQYSLK